MRVYKCDRCGRFFKRNELMVMTAPILPVYFNFRIKRHVCGDCASDFKRWWRYPNSPKLVRNHSETKCEKEQRG